MALRITIGNFSVWTSSSLIRRWSAATLVSVVVTAFFALSAQAGPIFPLKIMNSITLTGEGTSTQVGPPTGYAARYNGEYTITADYTIFLYELNGQVFLNPDGSTVTLTDKKANFGAFNTIPTQITFVTGDLANGDITSFTFAATDWYKNAPAGLIQNGISGDINLKNPSAIIRASYQFEYPRAGEPKSTLTYIFTSPSPSPVPLPTEDDLPPWDPIPPLPLPEPPAFALFAAGLIILAGTFRARLVRA